MYRFDVSIHARPPGVSSGSCIELHGVGTNTLSIEPTSLSLPFNASFEQACEQLGALPRLDVEPDGFFVWIGEGQSWQIEGNLYDRSGHLIYVEMRGMCPPQSFDQLLAAFGWPTCRLIFQLRQHAVYLEEGEFRRVASLPTESGK